MKKVLLFLLALILLAGFVAQAEHQMTKWDLIAKARLGTGLKPDDSTATIAVRQAMDFIQSAAIYPVCLDTIRIDFVADQELYALPADCYEPITVYMAPTGRALDWIAIQDKQRLPTESSISEELVHRIFYFQDDSMKYVGFDAVPAGGDSAQCVYEATATEIVFGSGADAQRVRIREIYHPALVAATKSFLYERWGREDKANRYLNKATWLINVAERKLGTPPVDVLLAPKTHTRP